MSIMLSNVGGLWSPNFFISNEDYQHLINLGADEKKWAVTNFFVNKDKEKMTYLNPVLFSSSNQGTDFFIFDVDSDIGSHLRHYPSDSVEILHRLLKLKADFADIFGEKIHEKNLHGIKSRLSYWQPVKTVQQ